MRRITFVIVLILAILCLGGPVGAKETFYKGSSTFKLSSGSKKVNFVSFYASDRYELRPALAYNLVGKVQDLAGIATSQKAVAAINGTFFNAYNSADLQPLGMVMINGQVKHYKGSNTALSIDSNNQIRLGNTSEIRIRGSINGSYDWPNNWYAWFINHSPGSTNEIIIFTPDYRTRSLNFPKFNFVTVAGGKVTAITADKATIPPNGFVIAYGNTPANQNHLKKFQMGAPVSYQVTFPASLGTNPKHMVSLAPKLVSKGVATSDYSNFTDPKIRSASSTRSFIGMTKDRKIVMGTAFQVTNRDLEQIAIKFGLVEAAALDGGASSGLYAKGKYLTKPGRNLSNALVVVQK